MKNNEMQFSTFIYRYDEGTDTEAEFDVEVRCNLYPEEPRTWHCPGNPAHCEVFSVLRDGKEIVDTLSQEELDRLEESAFEKAEQAAEDALAAYIDHAIDLWKEERILAHV